jgi:O-acetyl-ADP-ribose deacetylase (regulator of RNase III)
VLFHLLGPVASDVKKLDEYENKVYVGFKGLFDKCHASGLTRIQLTALSTGVFAAVPEPHKSDWIERSDHVFFRAMTEAVNDGKIKHIVLVDYLSMPWRDRI